MSRKCLLRLTRKSSMLKCQESKSQADQHVFISIPKNRAVRLWKSPLRGHQMQLQRSTVPWQPLRMLPCVLSQIWPIDLQLSLKHWSSKSARAGHVKCYAILWLLTPILWLMGAFLRTRDTHTKCYSESLETAWGGIERVWLYPIGRSLASGVHCRRLAREPTDVTLHRTLEQCSARVRWLSVRHSDALLRSTIHDHNRTLGQRSIPRRPASGECLSARNTPTTSPPLQPFYKSANHQVFHLVKET